MRQVELYDLVKSAKSLSYHECTCEIGGVKFDDEKLVERTFADTVSFQQSSKINSISFFRVVYCFNQAANHRDHM